jgi:hypothetical protein
LSEVSKKKLVLVADGDSIFEPPIVFTFEDLLPEGRELGDIMLDEDKFELKPDKAHTNVFNENIAQLRYFFQNLQL